MTYTAVAVLLTTLSFLLYHFVSSSEKTGQFFKKRAGNEQGQVQWVLFNRLLGAVVFSIPAIYFTLFANIPASLLGLVFKFNLTVYLILLALAVLPVLINKFTANKPANLSMYPQIRASIWPKSLVFASAISWVTYLLGYEILFRGVLFFLCLQEMSLVSAIAINISLYALVHLPKGFNESVGSIFMGIILCLLTYYSGSFWPAFILHCVLALSNEWYSLKYQPYMIIESKNQESRAKNQERG
jgi:membrane protease YdiL (CAAX protease family)